MLFFEMFTSFPGTTAVPHSRVEYPKGIFVVKFKMIFKKS